MRSRWELPSNKSHRSLSRTENSLQKLEQRRIKERTRSIPSKVNEPIVNEVKSPHRINFLGKVRTEIKELGDKARTKSGKKLISIFRRAHETNINQSFLKKIPKERTQKLHNEVRSVLKGGRSQGIPTIVSNESPSPQSKNSTENISRVLKFQPSNMRSPNDARFRTVSYLNRALTPEGIKLLQQEKEVNIQSDLKVEERVEAEVAQAAEVAEVIPVDSKVNSQASEIVPQEVRSIVETARVVQQKQKESGSKIPTVKKDFRQYSKRSASRSSQTQQKERIAVPQAPRQQQNNPKPQNTVTKKNEQPEEFNLDQLQTIQPIQRESSPKRTSEKQGLSPSKRKQPKQSNPKKDYYTSIYNDINDIDIDEITLISATNQPKKQSQPQPQPKVQKDWSNMLQNAKQSNNPYLPIDSHSKDPERIQQKMPRLGESLQSKVEEEVKVQKKKSVTKVEEDKQQPKKEITTNNKKADESPKKQESNQSQSQKSQTKNSQKQQIIQTLTKISKAHSQLQMLGELATYFSKHTKTYKLSQQNKAFLRNQSLSWHFLIYLFFKYFYYMLLLFIKYYHFSAQTVMIKKEQLKELSQENEKWAQTLAKIQKSVRKNAKANSYEEDYFKDPEALNDLSQTNVQGLVRLYFRQQGSEQSFQFSKYMKSLRTKLFKQVTSFIKSMNLSNILSTQGDISLIFQQSAYRVFNATIIIYQFHNPDLPHLSTRQSVQQLDHPLLADFKTYYQKLTKEILLKK